METNVHLQHPWGAFVSCIWAGSSHFHEFPALAGLGELSNCTRKFNLDFRLDALYIKYGCDQTEQNYCQLVISKFLCLKVN